MTPTNDLLLRDVHRFKSEGPDVKHALEAARTRWRPMFQGIENAHFGIEVCQDWARRGYAVRRLKADKDKLSRSLPASIMMENGKMYFLQGASWLADYEEELLRFNKGDYDDQVDVTSYAAAIVNQNAPNDDEDVKPLDFGAANRRGQFVGA